MRGSPPHYASWLLITLWIAGSCAPARAESAAAQPEWLPAPSGAGARGWHEMTYDSARGRVVLFGGSSMAGLDPGRLLGDTWEWDGSTWSERTPPSGPAARNLHAMAYDAARGRVVLFGGDGELGFLGDTWEWDGTLWIEHTPGTGPSPRQDPGMAYDAARARVVLFGGRGESGWLDDTWEWDGLTWISRAPTTRPPSRYGHAMAYDVARARVVLFGGFSGSAGLLDDVWEWDGNEWVERTPLARPAARSSHAMVYDAARGSVVLFGGHGKSGKLLDDTSEWDGGKRFVRTSASGPAARTGVAMAYDSLSGHVVLQGGATSGLDAAYYSDTWVYIACPGTAEICNGLDDGNDRCLRGDEVDADGDGWVECEPWTGSDPAIVGGGDCGPADAATYPGAPEIEDGRDNDCDGAAL